MERKLNISSKAVGILILFLLVIISVCSKINYSGVQTDDSAITIYDDGTEAASYSLVDLRQMVPVSEELHIESTGGEDEDGVFTGVMLEQLLKKAGIESCKTIIFTAGDGYSVAIKADEMDKVLVVYEKNGAALEPFSEGGAGPFRIAVIGDPYGNRSLKCLAEIRCKP